MQTKRFSAVLLMLLAVLMPLRADDREAFAAAYRQVHEARDVPGFMALVEVAESTPDWLKAQLADTFITDSRLKITGIEFHPLEPDFNMVIEYEGVTYVPTLTPELRMAISFDEEGQGEVMITGTTYTLGRKDGGFRIVSPKPQD